MNCGSVYVEVAMPNSDILIIGGGPAGLTTAGALKQIGINATIIDRSSRV
jgi:2-polyprenyl-6-methoxyphenol hydroxylase-like FAD-dependent oxidoreductase